MTKVHGIAYLILGALVSGFSYYIDNRNKNNSFVLFFYIGIIFIIIGLLKLIGKYIQKKANKQAHKATRQHPYLSAHQQRICSFCRVRLRYTDHFCPMCGQSVYQLR